MVERVRCNHCRRRLFYKRRNLIGTIQIKCRFCHRVVTLKSNRIHHKRTERK